MEPGEPDGLPKNAVAVKLRDSAGRVIAVVRVVPEHDDKSLASFVRAYISGRDPSAPGRTVGPRLMR